MNSEDPNKLIDAMLDRELSASEFQAFQQALRQSKSLRREYMRIAQASAELECEFGTLAEDGTGGPACCEFPPAVVVGSVERQRTRAATARGSFWSGAILAACVFGLVGVGVWWSIEEDGTPGVQATSEDNERPAGVVATLTGAVDCVWAEGAHEPVYGAPVEPGEELELLSGLVQLTFESGAKVVLEGPARFTPHERMYASLGLGRATAVVPQEAVGFQIDTPSAEIVDLGTAFGVDVALSGESEVHVLEGDVLSRALASHEEGAYVHLVKHTALRFSPGSTEYTKIEAAADRFVTDVRPRLLPKELPHLPVHRSLALWLSADSLVEKDELDRVVAWNDIRTGDNLSDEIAWQSEEAYRPLWVPSGIGGKPSVRFQGDFQHLVTTPLATTSNQSIFIVFAQHERHSVGDMRQLLSYNGPPVRYLEDLTDPGVLQIDDQLRPGCFYARVYVCARKSQMKEWPDPHSVGFCNGECVAQDELPLFQPAVLSYIYSTRDNHSALYMDGELQSTSDALFNIAVNSRKVIGKHGKAEYDGFSGDISEVIIFNDRLTDEEIRSVNRYLIEKYGIAAAVTEPSI